jgi:phosphate transport system protein
MPRTSDYTEGHTVRAFDAEMEELRTLLLETGGLVADQVTKAVAALVERDPTMVELVMEREEEVNRRDLAGEEMVFGLLAKRQPVGADLRAILAMSKGLTDLERCGDEAKKIAKIARRFMNDGIPADPRFTHVVSDMARLASRLLKWVLEALDDADAKRAVEVAEADGRLDSEYKLALRLVHEHLIEEPNKIDHAADLVIAIKALERIGDHAKNIARYVIFLVEGKDVRHVKTKHLGEELSSS